MSAPRYQAFTMLPNRIIRDHDLPLSAFKFACVIAMHRDHEGGWTVMGSRTALCRMGLGRDGDRGYIGKLAKLLAAKGYIDYRRGEGLRRSRYRLIMDEQTDQPIAAEDPCEHEALMDAEAEASMREDEEAETISEPASVGKPDHGVLVNQTMGVGIPAHMVLVKQANLGVGKSDAPIRDTLLRSKTPLIQEREESLPSEARDSVRESLFQEHLEAAQEAPVPAPSSPVQPSVPTQESTKRACRKNAALLDECVAIWNEVCGGRLPKVLQMTDRRRSALAARLHGEFNDNVEEWRAYCERIMESDFLTGGKGWRATFDWATNPTNAIKVCENSYENRSAGGKPKSWASAMFEFTGQGVLDRQERENREYFR